MTIMWYGVRISIIYLNNSMPSALTLLCDCAYYWFFIFLNPLTSRWIPQCAEESQFVSFLSLVFFPFVFFFSLLLAFSAASFSFFRFFCFVFFFCSKGCWCWLLLLLNRLRIFYFILFGWYTLLVFAFVSGNWLAILWPVNILTNIYSAHIYIVYFDSFLCCRNYFVQHSMQ